MNQYKNPAFSHFNLFVGIDWWKTIYMSSGGMWEGIQGEGQPTHSYEDP